MAKTIAGSLIGKALGAYGTKPEIPELPQLNPSAIQGETAVGNLAVLPQAQQLAAAVNKGNAAQLRAILNQGGQLDLAEKVVGSQLRGELPADVQRQITDYTTAQANSLGLPGTGFQTGIAGLRGALTSLQLQQQGLANFGSLSRLTTPHLMGPESMFFTPQQRLNFAFRDREQRFQRDLLAAQVKAMPNPSDVAMAEGLDNFFAFWAGVGGAALGGMGSGGALTTKGNPGVGQSGGPEGPNFGGFNTGGISEGAGAGTGEGGPMGF